VARHTVLESGNIPAYELEALYDLYNATNGAAWIWTPYEGVQWEFTATANPCAESWQGVLCTTTNTSVLHVNMLSLPAMNLRGTIPHSIGVLSELQQLYLQTNSLHGEIPSSIGNCSGLTIISLYENSLNGTLPDTICTLRNLTRAELYKNDLSGSLPDHFSAMTKLQVFNIGKNKFTGPLPATLGSCLELTQFIAADNDLHGTLPDSYGALTKLQYLAVFSNSLYGTIPASYDGMVALTYFHVYNNQLSGTIPDMFGGMPFLEYFYAGLNHLSGSLPDSLSLALNLYTLDVSNNFLNGTLPSSLGNLVELNVFEGFNNMFAGILPPELGDCTYMFYFLLSNNQLTGTLPASFSSWVYLSDLKVDNNALSGSIPAEYGAFTNINTFQLNSNFLDGTLSEELGAMVKTAYFVVNNNMLSGSLPEALFASMTSLSSVDAADNFLTGFLPDSLSLVPRLAFVDVYNNFLTGTLPASYGALSDLLFFYCDNNQLTGAIPDSYGGMRLVQELYIQFNLLSGTLPDAMGNLTSLQFFIAEYNMLSGSVPTSFAGLGSMIALLLNNNHLTGTIEGIFNASRQIELVTIVMNDNQLSGTLPDELFLLPKLNSFGAVSNCFHGQLPATVCGASSLVTLALDGLSSAGACRDALLPGISSSYVVHRAFHGSIPACVFSLPVLTTLHLSGNGFSGSLSDAPITPYLLDLSLSHNIITGTIPDSIQRRNWYNLDLSYNRLEGSLLTAFASEVLNATYFDHLSAVIGINVTQEDAQSTLSLETNRLSGNLPQVIQSRQNVSVLGSNVFACNLEESDLPKHDDGRRNYQCGSDSFNVPFYLWLSLVCVVAVIALVVWRYQAEVERYVGFRFTLRDLHKWATVLESHRDIVPDDRVKSYRSVLELSGTLCKIAAQSTVYIVLVLLPLYVGSSSSYGTLLHQYAWTVSAAYLTGWVPTILMLVCLLGLLVLVLVGFTQYLTQHPQSAVASNMDVPARSTALVVLIYALFLIMNLVVVVGANTAYVVIAIYGPSNVLFLAQLALSCFKLFWNRFFSVYLIRWTARLEALVRPTADPSSAPRSVEAEFVTLQMAVALLNNIAIPCLVVAGISPSCFYNVFVVAPKVTTTYTFQSCAYVAGSQCVAFAPENIETSYNPPFTYNYQCSSSFITYYAPTFVLLCLMHAFVSPVAQFALQQLHSRAAPNTHWFALLDSVLLPNLKPIAPGEPAQVNVFKPFFDANQLLLSLFTYLGLLLTFGAVFPPVALAMLVTLLAVLHFNKLKVSRFLCQAMEQNQLDYVDAVESESGRSGFLPVLERAVWMLVTVSCWFYTLFLFDTLGDAVGFEGAYWVLIVMPLMPLVVYVLWRGVSPRVSLHAADGEGMEERATEMSELGETTVNILRLEKG
jgi:Leucine-rich repeat (LRR) protein